MTNETENRKLGLKIDWENFRAEHPYVRIRDAAARLGVSEAELVSAESGENSIRLNDRFDELLTELESLGRIMALSRNEAIVHERKGIYKNVEILKMHGKMGLVVGEDIDLRIFFNNWHYGFAVKNMTPRGWQRSFQFFDIDGKAVHKVFLTEKSDLTAYEKLIQKFQSGDQVNFIAVKSKPAKPAEKADSEIDVKEFRAAWAAMTDTHEFFGLTRKFGVSREQALRLAGGNWAYRASTQSYQYILRKAVEAKMPIMVFVGNAGIIQIHTGEIENIAEARGWFNVLDENFNLHIRQQQIGSIWVVKKPTADGIVTSLELFDVNGENAALIFGSRKPGNPERNDWRELISTVRPLK